MRAIALLVVFIAGLSSPAEASCTCLCVDGKTVAVCASPFAEAQCPVDICSYNRPFKNPFHAGESERPKAPYLGPPPPTAPKPEPPTK